MRKLFLFLFLMISACGTIEKRAGCDLPPLPTEALLYWNVEGGGLDVLSVIRDLPVEKLDNLTIERDGERVTAVYLDEESKAVLEHYAACRAMQ